MKQEKKLTLRKSLCKLSTGKKVNISPYTIKMGEHVLLKQKSSKGSPIYDPDQYIVKRIWGTQIEGTRDGKKKRLGMLSVGRQSGFQRKRTTTPGLKLQGT